MCYHVFSSATSHPLVIGMHKLCFVKRVWIVKQRIRGVFPSKIALAQNVSEGMVRRLFRIYKQFGWDGLKDHKTGRPETLLNPNAELLILDLRKRFLYGACRIEEVLKQRGFSISHRQIEKVLIKKGLQLPNVRKQKSRKWVRYELPNPNDLWHTDWTYDPYTSKQLSVYLDDRTRLITSYAIYERATAENSISLLKIGIASYGKPKAVMTDHGTQYYAAHPEAKQENTQYRTILDALGIKHYLARINRPQTNGKVERFFLSYKTEYATGTFNNIKEYITHYNENRPHMSLQNKTPIQTWKELTTV